MLEAVSESVIVPAVPPRIIDPDVSDRVSKGVGAAYEDRIII